MVTLEIPPYRFKRKTDAKEIGKRAYFECNSCDKLDEKTSAHAIKHEDENGEIFYELVSWPRNHECAPSATSHLARIFRDRCYAAVAADPMKPIFQIYKDLRTDIGRELTDEERKSFNCEIQELYSLKVQLYKHRRKFIPKAPQSFVSYIIYL